MSNEKVIEKIRKLLARTEENGCTPGEAATAAAQVAMLLAKYNLAISDINSEEMELVKEEFIKDTKSCSAYQAEIASALEKHFGVTTFLKRKYNANHTSYSILVVYGEKIKVQAFCQTYEFVYRAYQKCWTSYHKTLDEPTSLKSKRRLSYLRGFIDGVTNEIIKEENANALVVSKSQSVIDFENNLVTGRAFNVNAIRDAQANARGYSDGTYAQQHRHTSLS